MAQSAASSNELEAPHEIAIQPLIAVQERIGRHKRDEQAFGEHDDVKDDCHMIEAHRIWSPAGGSSKRLVVADGLVWIIISRIVQALKKERKICRRLSDEELDYPLFQMAPAP